MPEFAYTARTLAGERVTGLVSANNEREAIANLASKTLFPIEVKAEKGAGAGLSVSFLRRVKGQTMATAYSQLALLLRAGVPLLKSLKVMEDQTSNKVLKGVLDDVHHRVEEGATLAEAMSRHAGIFGEMAINMVRAGGEGGFLEDALDRVAQFTEQQEDLKGRTMGALAYPVFLSTVGTLVIIGLMIFVVPNFEEMFQRLRDRGEMPWPTEALLGFSGLLRSWGWLLLIILGVGAVLLYLRQQTEAGRRIRDLIKIKIPVAGSIFQNLAVARFCRVLGTMLRNGVPILRSLEISRLAAGNVVLSDAIAKASENISAGQSLAAPLSSSGHFPRTVVEMIAVAEESNTLDNVLVEIADGLERRTARRLELVVRMIEPVMLLILAGMVLLVVIALLLPIVRMSSAL